MVSQRVYLSKPSSKTASVSILLVMKGNIMSIEQVKALVRELVADGILYATVAHNIDWARYEDAHLRSLLVSILIDLKGN